MIGIIVTLVILVVGLAVAKFVFILPDLLPAIGIIAVNALIFNIVFRISENILLAILLTIILGGLISFLIIKKAVE